LIFGGKQMYVLPFLFSLCGSASISVASNSRAVVLFGKRGCGRGKREGEWLPTPRFEAETKGNGKKMETRARG
jgi:hypothetical protein